MNINLTSCKKIYTILDNISKEEEKIKKREPDTTKADIYFLIIGSILFTYACIIKTIVIFTNPTEPLEMAIFFLLIIGYFLIITSPIIGIIIEFKKNFRKIKNPLAILFNRMNNSTEADIKALKDLIHFDQNSLEICLMELKHELEDFNKRITNITGPISKIGLFPAILIGLTTISTQLGEKKFILLNLEPLNQFIVLLSIAIIILYFVSIHANFKATDLERRLKLLEFTIKLKKDKKSIIQLL